MHGKLEGVDCISVTEFIFLKKRIFEPLDILGHGFQFDP